MAFERLGRGALDYYPCRYGSSKLLFRGPRKKLDEPYCAVIGGTETYGKFVEDPYPALLEDLIGKPVVNLGCLNAGSDVFILDDTVMDICNRAEITIVQITGAQNISNRFYSVHPRRNDRFLCGTGLTRRIFRSVDLTDVHFTRHLLGRLADASPEKFSVVRDELKDAWVSRMERMLDQIGGRIILLWLADHAPFDDRADATSGADPMFVDRGMLSRVSDLVTDIVEVVATREEILAGQERMLFTPLEELVAQEMFGPVVHEMVASELQRVIQTVQ